MSGGLQSSLAGIVVVVALAGLIIALWSEPEWNELQAPLAPEAQASDERADAQLSASADPAREAERAEPAEPDAETAVADEPPADAEAERDLYALAPITIRVVDSGGLPVEDAEVAVRGMRSEEDPGSWHSYPGEAPVGRTGFDGRVELDHLVWVDIDGRTCALDVTVGHPDFAPFRDHSFEVGPGEHEVVLERGATVVVSGWIGSKSVVVTDVAIEVEREARLGDDAWERLADGRLATARLAPGPHRIRLEHESEEHGRRFSAITPFELAAADWKELHLELVAAEQLVGELDPTVPRPIVNGRVLLDLHEGGRRHDEPTLSRSFEAEVNDDGSFVIEALPPGAGQIIAFCDGWVSRRTLADSFVAEDGEEPGDLDFVPQRVAVPQTTTPLFVAMERAGAAAVTVQSESGTPLANAYVTSSPNVHFEGVGALIFPWGDWSAKTDASGVARIENLPPTAAVWLRVQHATHRMRAADRASHVAVAIRAGETTAETITLEPIE